jgi:transposase
VTNIAQFPARRLTVGVDTHLDNHVAALKDELGRDLADKSFPANSRGYKELLLWTKGFGEVEAFGIEGTGSYGAGLARFLTAEGQSVLEVGRPKRQDRRRHGKSDPADARAAAKTLQAGEATGIPKSGDDRVEMIRTLRVAKQSAMKARTQTVNVLKAELVTAPAALREELHGLTLKALLKRCAASRPGDVVDPTTAVEFALRGLAKRYQDLDREIDGLMEVIGRLSEEVAPALLATFGVGPDVASALLVAAGDNPERMKSEAAFSMLCGSSPVDASSGKQIRHRLNRGGDRQANAALYRIVMVRLRWHEPTRQYTARRTAEGKTKKEVIRCLKRFVAREIYNVLTGLRRGQLAGAA